MMDFNSTSSISGQITALVDAGMQRARAQQSERQYLGASRSVSYTHLTLPTSDLV